MKRAIWNWNIVAIVVFLVCLGIVVWGIYSYNRDSNACAQVGGIYLAGQNAHYCVKSDAIIK